MSYIQVTDPLSLGVFDESRNCSRFPLPLLLPLPLPCPFVFPAPLPPPDCPGVESASIAPLVSYFRWSFLAQSIRSRARRRPMPSVSHRRLRQSSSARILSNSTISAKLCQECVAQDHFKYGDRQAGGNELPSCVKNHCNLLPALRFPVNIQFVPEAAGNDCSCTERVPLIRHFSNLWIRWNAEFLGSLRIVRRVQSRDGGSPRRLLSC